jgi:ABC-2 type transport system permease protein
MTRLLQDTYHLMIRALRESIRQPTFELPNIFIPIFFFLVTVGAIGGVAGRAFGVTNYAAFQMPVAILQGVAGGAGSAGLGMVTDIEGGYFQKLLLTPAPRLSLVLGRFIADGIRVMGLTVVLLGVGLIAGSGMATGPLGALSIVLLAGMFGLAYAGIGMTIALQTGSTKASQAGFLVFFPLLFLSPAFAPKDVFSGWLQFLATINPVTYILEGMRTLILDGWSWRQIIEAVGAIGGFAAFTWTTTLWALSRRTR